MKKAGNRKEVAGKTKARVKVGKSKTNKETLRDLSPSTKKQIQGGGFGGFSMGIGCVIRPK